MSDYATQGRPAESREEFATKVDKALGEMKEGPWPVSLDEETCGAIWSMLAETKFVKKDN